MQRGRATPNCGCGALSLIKQFPGASRYSQRIGGRNGFVKSTESSATEASSIQRGLFSCFPATQPKRQTLRVDGSKFHGSVVTLISVSTQRIYFGYGLFLFITDHHRQALCLY